ncbi:unnamed protein product [Adineta steineri]|uniref:Uncharacterized protein n=1 Tax=Adineta steineri TaxID=433720 RepID=A0A815IEB1_9BILA|nr:unnamed protein product [Adineta steineri]CAF1364821.1 unnamed protein product [Adineta steineri]
MCEWYIYSRPWSTLGPDCMSCTDVIDSFCDQDNLNKYSLNHFEKLKTLRGTSTAVIPELSNDDKNCSSFYLVYPYLVLVPGIETTFLSVRIQKFIYSSKTKAKMNQSTNVEVRGKYHDNICDIGQEGTYSHDLWIFPMDNKIDESIFTFESIILQQV